MKPILFNTEMVRAILDGRKNVTRRLVKPQHLRVLDSPYHKEHQDVPDKVLLSRLCDPPYRPGDILYVRETWSQTEYGGFLYRAWPEKGQEPEKQDEAMRSLGLKWRPSIHMPREAARILLRVTDVRVEKVQEITWQQAAAEGCQGEACDELEPRNDGLLKLPTLLGAFRDLWDSTVKHADRERYGWEANPFCWVIEFERCEKPEEDT